MRSTLSLPIAPDLGAADAFVHATGAPMTPPAGPPVNAAPASKDSAHGH